MTRALRPSGRLGRQAVAITRAGDVPITLVPGPETLEAWVRQGADDPAIARGAAAVEDAAGRDQVVTGTYVPTNLPSLLAAGLGSAVDAQLVRGDATLGRILATRPDVRTASRIPSTRRRSRGCARGASTTSSWTPRRSRPAAARSRPGRSCSNRRPRWYRAVPCPPSPATQRSRSCSEPLVPPRSRAQRVLAALSVIAFEDPTNPRAITMLNPPDLDPPIDLLDALLTGLRGNPLLAPMTVDEVFALVPAETTANGTPVTRQLAAYAPPPPPVNTLTYGAARLRLDAFRSLAGPADPVVVRGERSLLVCQSATFVGVRGNLRAHATVKSIDRSIDAFLARIRIPRPSTITLTSRSGSIPLTFRNDTGKTIDVFLELASAKLTFPEGATRTLRLPTRSTTLRVPVEARTSGTFPLHLTVTSADGALSVANSTFRVRSTAVSTVGIVLMVGAVVFLIAWWGVHIRRNRRTRRAA